MTERLHFHFSFSCIGEGNGSPLQCSCLENPRDRGAWWAALYGVTQSWTRLKWLSSYSSRPQPIRLLCPWDSLGKDTGVGHALLWGVFPIQGSNPHLLCPLHWQTDSLPLAPPGKPIYLCVCVCVCVRYEIYFISPIYLIYGSPYIWDIAYSQYE